MKICLSPRDFTGAQAIFHCIPLLSSQYSYILQLSAPQMSLLLFGVMKCSAILAAVEYISSPLKQLCFVRISSQEFLSRIIFRSSWTNIARQSAPFNVVWSKTRGPYFLVTQILVSPYLLHVHSFVQEDN